MHVTQKRTSLKCKRSKVVFKMLKENVASLGIDIKLRQLCCNRRLTRGEIHMKSVKISYIKFQILLFNLKKRTLRL